MVRFYDIVRTQGKKNPEKNPVEAGKHKEGVRLSDSWFFKSRTDISSDKKTLSGKALFNELGSYYTAFIDRAHETSEWVKNDMQINVSPVLSDLNVVMEKDLVDNLYEYAMSIENDHEDIFTHTADVIFTALKIGKGMNYNIKMMLRLGLAAFFQNIGMYKILKSNLSHDEELSINELALIKKHPETGYYLLQRLGDKYTWLAETILSIHERGDGSGLKEKEIPELSAIIGLADSYCAMIKNRPYKKKLTRHDAIKYIANEGKGKFPSKIIKVFLDRISLFPVNSYVKLNNGSIGRVISTNRKYPLSPDVEILYDSEGKKLKDAQQVFLSDDPLLYIETGIDPDDFTY